MDYEINKETLLVYPIENGKTKIIELNNSYETNMTSFQVIEHSCEYFGSTLSGRQKGTKALIGVTHKSPIFIEESSNIIFFPITSPRKQECMWISFNNISSFKSSNSHKSSIIKFKSGEEIEVPASIGTITNQILRSSRLQVVLNDRKKEV